MATIYLIRHGQASFAKEDYDNLSELGEQQASRLGQVLAQRLGQFDRVHLGSMRRHRQTADTCLTAMGANIDQLAPKVDAAWNEYDHQDILRQFDERFITAGAIQSYISEQTNPKAAFKQLFDQAVERWMSGHHDHEYDESWSAYRERIHGALQALSGKVQGSEKVAVFSSGGPIALLSQALLGVPVQKIMQLNWTLVNCGVSKLVSSANGVILSSLNEHTAFEGQFQSLISYK
jgi:broad specificity phosphatase PhoE